MLAAAHCLQPHGHVELVGCADEDGVHLGAAAQLAVIGEHLHRLGQMRREVPHPLLDEVAQRGDATAPVLGDGQPVGLADAHADDPDPHLLWHRGTSRGWDAALSFCRPRRLSCRWGAGAAAGGGTMEYPSGWAAVTAQ